MTQDELNKIVETVIETLTQNSVDVQKSTIEDAVRNMEAYSFATFACSVAVDANGEEMIYWEE